MDGQVIQSTTKKIVDVRGNRTIRDNKKYQQMRFASCSMCTCVLTGDDLCVAHTLTGNKTFVS